ncbi:MAG: Rieske 2Fe-2S domain-containing protein [Acetobacteraceae bacterium]
MRVASSKGFAGVWTPLVKSRPVRARLLPAASAGEHVVLFRTPDGTPAALPDQCPHRGVRLSLGRLTPNGCIECAFHGWQFDRAGENQRVPLPADAKRQRLGAEAFPVRELGALIRLYTGHDPAQDPTVPDALVNRDVSRTYVGRDWNVH